MLSAVAVAKPTGKATFDRRIVNKVWVCHKHTNIRFVFLKPVKHSIVLFKLYIQNRKMCQKMRKIPFRSWMFQKLIAFERDSQ